MSTKDKKRVNLAFTRSGSFVMSGGVAVDIDYPYSPKEIEKAYENSEFAEYLPLDVKYFDDEWEFEEIEETGEENSQQDN